MSEVIHKPRMTADTMIDKYVRLRDKVKEIKARHTEELAPYGDAMNVLEGWMLEAMNQAGLKSMKSVHGTAYKSLRTSTKVVDWTEALRYIRENEAWDLLEARVSKSAAAVVVEETGAPIPGVETTSEITVNVRRASATAGSNDE
jgi:hypothetical protein